MQFAVWALLIAVGLWLLRFHRGRAVGLSLLVLVLYFIAGMLVFQGSQSWMPLMVSLGLIGCCVLCGLILCGGVVDRESDKEVEETKS